MHERSDTLKKIDKLVSEDEIEDAELNSQLANSGSVNNKWDDFMKDDSSGSSDEDDGFGDLFNNSHESHSGDIDDLLNSSSGGGSPWDMQYHSQYNESMPVTQEKSPEDKFFEVIKAGGKGFIAFLKEFVESTKKADIQQVVNWGKTTIVVSTIITVIGILLAVFGVKIGLPILIGSLISLASGLCIFGIAFDKQKKRIGQLDYMAKLQNNEEDEEEVDLDAEDEEIEDEDMSNVEDEDEDDLSELLGGETDDTQEDTEEDISDVLGNSNIDWNILDEEDSSGQKEESRAWDDEEEPEYKAMGSSEGRDNFIESIDIDRNTVTRSYLVESYDKVLPAVNPTYSQRKDCDSDTREFKAYNALIQKAAKLAVGKKGLEDIPCLKELSDRALYTKLVVTRTEVDIKKFVVELTQLMSYDKETDEVDEDLHITYRVVGDEWILKVFTGKSVMVSIQDTYNDDKVKKFIGNTKNLMPVVLGINEEGEAVILDVEKVNSLLITGMPRSGKSWFALALLTQLTMYMKPSQLEIYMIDPKGASSDFADFMPPHVKCFVSEHQDIIDLLTRLIDVEAKRRTDMFATQNVKKIQDWNAKNPTNPCPYIYVYIDEVVTLAEAMDKETKAVFQSKLMEITTRLPSLGIRPILVPHVVKNQFLNKSITDNIPCRISVKGDAKHIETCVGEDTPPFTYKLTHTGDMAVMLLDRHIHFVHSVIVTPSVDDNIEVFEFIRKLWEKLEPESIPSSCYYKKEHGISLTTIGEVPEKTSDKVKHKINEGNKKQGGEKKVAAKRVQLEEVDEDALADDLMSGLFEDDD